MSAEERRFAVWLKEERVGTLTQRLDYTWFSFTEEYLGAPERAVLGLAFENDLTARRASNVRLPPWFSNLLPEGKLRDWIADDRGVSADREMELLAQVGFDLPGAVRVLPEETSGNHGPPERIIEERGHVSGDDVGWRFSLAGVALKFSMIGKDDRLTLPAFGEGGDWIVKLPDALYQDVPANEFTMMSLAAAAGIDVPDRKLLHRDMLEGLPDRVWQGAETHAYAVRRFDRGRDRELVHIEDLAQVKGVYPLDKYSGTFETIASLIYRGHGATGLLQFVRRLVLNILIANGDAHLKNWSLIYEDERVPSLAPAYDLVSTEFYVADRREEDLGMRFAGTKRLDSINLAGFRNLARRLAVDPALVEHCVVETVERVVGAWPEVSESLAGNDALRHSVGSSIERRARSLAGIGTR